MIQKHLFIIILIVVLPSCCKKIITPIVNVTYSSLDHSAEFWMYRVEKDNHSVIIDSVGFGHLNEENDFSISINLSAGENYDLILQADSGSYIDTITALTYEVKGRNCNARLENLEYYVNGVSHSNGILEID